MKNIPLLIKGTNDAEKTLYEKSQKPPVIEKCKQPLHACNIGQDTGLAAKQTHTRIITLTLKQRKCIKRQYKMV